MRSCGVGKFWLWGFGDLSGTAVAGAWGAGFGENRFVAGLKLSPSTPVPGSPEFRQPGATRNGNCRVHTGWLIWHRLGGTGLAVLAWRYRLGGTGLVALSWQAGHGSARALASGVTYQAQREPIVWGGGLGGIFQLRNSATPGGGCCGVAELRSWKRAPVFPGGSRGRMNHEAHGLDPARRPPWVPP